MTVEWPDRRVDVLTALGLLAAAPPRLAPDGRDPRWPGLTDAVHWLVDDTSWDQHDPAGSIGTILRDEEEVASIRRVVTLVVAVAERQGASAPDVDWFADAEWSQVRAAARDAADRLHSRGT